MKIYVGNLSYSTNSEQLAETFGPFGQVLSADVITDRYSGQSRGFGFVEMADASEAQAAITELNGKDLGGRALTVNEAKPRESRDSRGGSGGGSPRW